MFDLLLINACMATMDGAVPFGLIDNGAIGVVDGTVTWVGPMEALPSREAGAVRDCYGKVVTPGLVDPHTHIVYGEEGYVDFEVLTQGGERWDLEKRQAGVGGLVRRTRALSEDELYTASKARMARLIANGVTTVGEQVRCRPRYGDRITLIAGFACTRARVADNRASSITSMDSATRSATATTEWGAFTRWPKRQGSVSKPTLTNIPTSARCDGRPPRRTIG